MTLLPVDVVTVPYDSGRRNYRMGAGPQALLRNGLVQALRARDRDMEVVPVEAGVAADELATTADLLSRMARVIRASRSAGRFPLVLTGSCMSTVGALAGVADDCPGVIWLDAHGDLNTPDTSSSGFLDGMAAAACVGWCHADLTRSIAGFAALEESRLLLVGARDLDPPEAAALDASAITHVPPGDIGGGSATSVLDSFAAPLQAVYLHIDLDVLDPERVGPANVFAAEGGLTVEAVAGFVRAVGARVRICGLTLSAYDPAVDTSGAVRLAAIELAGVVLDTAART